MLARIHEEMVESLKHLDQNTQWRILLAYINYQLYDIEPSSEDILVYTIFKAKQFDLDSIKNDIKSSIENGKRGWRPQKNFKNSSKPKHNLKKPNHILKEPNHNLTKPEQEQEKEQEKEKENNILSPIGDNSGADLEEKEYWNSQINSLIKDIKECCSEMGVAYDKTKERLYAKQILTSKDYGSLCEKINQWRVEFALNILRASEMINYRRGVCSGPMTIYKYYADVYNATMQKKWKNITPVLDDL